MIRRSAMVLVSLVRSAATAEAQGPRPSELSVLRPPDTVATPAAALTVAQRRTMSRGARTALWAGIGAAAGFLLANVTTDEDGIRSAELIGAIAGAATGAAFSLIVIPALSPSGS